MWYTPCVIGIFFLCDKDTKLCDTAFYSIINSEIIFSNLYDQNRSFYSDLGSNTWFFETSYKKTYFNTVFRIFLARYQSKKIQKHCISTKLDKGYRLVYELSYLDEKKFSLYFDQKGGSLPKKKSKIFSRPDMTIQISG